MFSIAKAVELEAEICYSRCRPACVDELSTSVPSEVFVTLGLFSIVKLFRIVNLSVESKGFSIPEEMEAIAPLNPCDFFENLDFPMDFFAPPQKPEYMAGISSNIAPVKKEAAAPKITKMLCECTPVSSNDDNCGCGYSTTPSCGYGR